MSRKTINIFVILNEQNNSISTNIISGLDSFTNMPKMDIVTFDVNGDKVVNKITEFRKKLTFYSYDEYDDPYIEIDTGISGLDKVKWSYKWNNKSYSGEPEPVDGLKLIPVTKWSDGSWGSMEGNYNLTLTFNNKFIYGGDPVTKLEVVNGDLKPSDFKYSLNVASGSTKMVIDENSPKENIFNIDGKSGFNINMGWESDQWGNAKYPPNGDTDRVVKVGYFQYKEYFSEPSEIFSKDRATNSGFGDSKGSSRPLEWVKIWFDLFPDGRPPYSYSFNGWTGELVDGLPVKTELEHVQMLGENFWDNSKFPYELNVEVSSYSNQGDISGIGVVTDDFIVKKLAKVTNDDGVENVEIIEVNTDPESGEFYDFTWGGGYGLDKSWFDLYVLVESEESPIVELEPYTNNYLINQRYYNALQNEIFSIIWGKDEFGNDIQTKYNDFIGGLREFPFNMLDSNIGEVENVKAGSMTFTTQGNVLNSDTIRIDLGHIDCVGVDNNQLDIYGVECVLIFPYVESAVTVQIEEILNKKIESYLNINLQDGVCTINVLVDGVLLRVVSTRIGREIPLKNLDATQKILTVYDGVLNDVDRMKLIIRKPIYKGVNFHANGALKDVVGNVSTIDFPEIIGNTKRERSILSDLMNNGVVFND